MSYGFAMRFKQCEGLEETLKICGDVCRKLAEPSAAIPYITGKWPAAKDWLFSKTPPDSHLLALWVKSVMEVKFVCWPHLNLIALVGNYPDEICSDFSKEVLFQDGTDQDYDFGTWPNDIFWFMLQKSIAGHIPPEKVEEELGYMPDDIGYARRTLMYKLIFDSLNLGNWLYGRDGRFRRITMSALNTREQELDITSRVKTKLKYELST